MFDIPVVIFLFLRSDTLPAIISRIAEVRPSRIYLLADAGRNEIEMNQAKNVRDLAESLITWDCEIIRNYATDNKGVYKNIGEGAKWVFQREETAIFIEDDNLPEVSFFYYAQEMLQKYKNENSILWVCGTNYITEMESEYSYCFTKHLLPCGWASWSYKFLKYYDGELKNFNQLKYKINYFRQYYPRLLGVVQYQSIQNEAFRYNRTGRFSSWDYQMLWSVRANDLYGIVPMKNQITNIGVDEYSIHGGNSNTNIMTDRFCEVPSSSLEFPLKHPPKITINLKCERALGSIICPPFSRCLKSVVGSKVKHLLGFDSNIPIKTIFSKLL